MPAEITHMAQWVAWNAEYRPDQSKPWTKVPMSCFRRDNRASSTRSYGWGYAAAAHKASQMWGYDGVGFVLTPTDDVCAIDLDNCRDPRDGTLTDWAREAIHRFDTYTESSPSGTGVRIICRGTLPGRGRKHNGREIYDRGRFVSMTGHPIGKPRPVQNRQDAIDWFLSTFPAPTDAATSVDLDDLDGVPELTSEEDEITIEVRQSPKGQKLWAGQWEGDYDSQSSADLALCSLIAKRTADPATIDKLFRNSGLYRGKWEERADYRERTIGLALADREEQPTAKKLAERFPDREPLPKADAPPAEPARKLRGYKLADLFAMPDPTWLVKRHLHKETLSVLVGEPGAGKSFYALDMALSVASGRPFLGCYDVAAGDVLYVAGEGQAGMRRRAMAWIAKKGGGTVPDRFTLIPRRVDLSNPEAEGIDGLQEVISRDMGRPPALVVIDTMARSFGGEENSAKDVGGFVAVCDHIREKTGAAVLVVHHTGKDASRGARGSTALLGAADSMFVVEKTNGGILVKNTKQKDAEELPTSILRSQPVTVCPDAEDEWDRTSLVFDLQTAARTAHQLLPAHLKSFLGGCVDLFGANPFSLRDTERVTKPGSNDPIPKSSRDRYLRDLAEKKLLNTGRGGYRISSDGLTLAA